jgi:hypothetical protein
MLFLYDGKNGAISSIYSGVSESRALAESGRSLGSYPKAYIRL